ncbi:MAG: hypothetical protein KBE16_07875 [Alphaproteobacteria bacterium]|nr:hypothetical protein [Alphaproteobacteria bacterium]
MGPILSYKKTDDDDEHMPDHVMIDKIDNGFLISTCCCDEPQKLYFDGLSQAPSLIAKMLGIKGKSREELSRMTKVEKTEEKQGKKTLVKMKITK